MLPNFLIIGAPKAGTTTLNFVLGAHPQVFMCPVKEAGFFWAYEQNIELQGQGFEKLFNRLVTDFDRYTALFDGAQGQRAIGESSVRYLASPQSPELIHRFIPEARLIVSLRQPADRAFSAFTHNLRDGLERCTDFADAIAEDRTGVRDSWMFCRYLNRGFYYRSLRRYLEYFDRSRIHISLLEDLKDNPESLYRGLFRFLDIDPNFTPDTSQRHNASGIIRNPLLRKLWTHSSRLRLALRPYLPPRWRHAAFEWVIQDLEKLPYPPELRHELTEYYREDILQLQDLIGRDLSAWLQA